MSFEQILTAPNKQWCDLYVHSINTTEPISSSSLGTTEVINVSLSGPWAAPIATTFTLYKSGNVVTIFFPQVLNAATTPAAIDVDVAIPIIYRPSVVTQYIPMMVFNNSGNYMGIISISVAGVLQFLPFAPSSGLLAQFLGTGNCGITSGSATYLSL